jgi:hypothetical protein
MRSNPEIYAKMVSTLRVAADVGEKDPAGCERLLGYVDIYRAALRSTAQDYTTLCETDKVIRWIEEGGNSLP